MANVDFGKYKRIVQYFWDPEPTNNSSSRSPIWCLGHSFNTSDEVLSPNETRSSSHDREFPHGRSTDALCDEEHTEAGQTEDGGWPKAFLDDFETRIWFTYRSGFPVIAKSRDSHAATSLSFAARLRSQLLDQDGFTSDTGWGCMIRSGQSLLANALLILRRGRAWRHTPSDIDERRLVALFADDPRAPFSIHKFVEHGANSCGKYPGEWFGPSATAQCIKALTDKCNFQDLRVYITGDGSVVYEDSFMSIAKARNGVFTPTLILIGTRLGLDKINPVYFEALSMCLKMPQAIGIAGGRPSSSHYFVGVQGPFFFYLDPHQTRPALPFPSKPEDLTQEDLDSCHTRRLRRIHFKDMDPSMLIAFLIRDEDEWRNWRQSVHEVQVKAVVHIADQDPLIHDLSLERPGAIDEVEILDDEDENEFQE